MSDGKGTVGERDFFISYTRADRAWAEWIAWVLEEDGYRVLIQAWDFVPGSNWMLGMQAGAQEAGRTIAVVSPAYLDSVYGGTEWQAAIAGDPDGTRRKLLVVRIAPCERPGLLAAVVGVDLFGIPEADARAQIVQMVLAAEAGRMKPLIAPNFPGSATGEQAPALQRPDSYQPPRDPRATAPAFYLSFTPSGGLRRSQQPREATITGRFFAGLTDNVSNLIPFRAGTDPGFMDAATTERTDWEPRLHALGNCQVFVALLSAPYLDSEECGKEWYAFSRRMVMERRGSDHRTTGASCILPVIWRPFPSSRLPRAVAHIQVFQPSDVADKGISELYRQNGLHGLMLSGNDGAYQLATWQLARRIAEITSSYEVEPLTFRYPDLRDIFSEPAD